jgi:hypothetical protein
MVEPVKVDTNVHLVSKAFSIQGPVGDQGIVPVDGMFPKGDSSVKQGFAPFGHIVLRPSGLSPASVAPGFPSVLWISNGFHVLHVAIVKGRTIRLSKINSIVSILQPFRMVIEKRY